MSSGSPLNLGGRIQQKMPAPFARPSITVGATPNTVRRAWRAVSAYRIEVGDVVPGIGRISKVEETVSTPVYGSGLSAKAVVDRTAWIVTLQGGADNTRVYGAQEMVWAFTART